MKDEDEDNIIPNEDETIEELNDSASEEGFGEISPDEFKNFIGKTIRLDLIMMDKNTSVEQLLSFYMGKNTPDIQEFIINNLKVELDTMEAS